MIILYLMCCLCYFRQLWYVYWPRWLYWNHYFKNHIGSAGSTGHQYGLIKSLKTSKNGSKMGNRDTNWFFDCNRLKLMYLSLWMESNLPKKIKNKLMDAHARLLTCMGLTFTCQKSATKFIFELGIALNVIQPIQNSLTSAN